MPDRSFEIARIDYDARHEPEENAAAICWADAQRDAARAEALFTAPGVRIDESVIKKNAEECIQRYKREGAG